MKVLLYSGGTDSWLIDKLWKPDIKLYINIGGKYSQEEIKNLPDDVKIINFNSLGQFERSKDMILPLRNLYFVMIASYFGDEICLGANKTDIVLDKTKEFACKASDILTYLYGKQKWTEERHIKVNVDFKDYTKEELIKAVIDKGEYTLEDIYKQTFSCYNPINNNICYNCRPCFLKLIALCKNGFICKEFNKYLPYIKDKLKSKVWEDRLYSREDYIWLCKIHGYNEEDLL